MFGLFGGGHKKEFEKLSTDEYEELQKDAFNSLRELATDSKYKWESLGEAEGVKKQRLHLPNSSVFVARGTTTMPHSLDTIVKAIADVDSRKQWDELFVSRDLKEMVHDHGVGNRLFVCHMKFKSPNPAVWPRDFSALTGSEYDTSAKKAIFFSRSVGHPDIPEDPKHYVRGQLMVSGYIIEEIEPNKCSVEYIVQLDPKGWIPTFVVQAVSAQQPLTLVKLSKYCNTLN